MDDPFKVGLTVRLGDSFGRPFGTPSQRRELWKIIEPIGFTHITIERTSRPDCIMHVRRDILVLSSVLDLMAARVDESRGVTR
jgi:hypothetical protein